MENNQFIQDLLSKLRNSETCYRIIPSHEKKILIDYCLENQQNSECLNILGCATEDLKQKKEYFEKARKMGNEYASINYIAIYCNEIYEKIYKLKKLNPKSDYGKFIFGKYLYEIGEYPEALEYLLNINRTFYVFDDVIWSIFLCYRGIGDLDLSLFYLTKSIQGYKKTQRDSDIKDCLLKLKDFDNFIITNISQKTIIYITNFFSSMLSLNLIEIIMEYFGVEVNS